MYKWLEKYWPVLLIGLFGALYIESVNANPDKYYQCRTEPMIVRVIDNGEVTFIAATSETTWIYGKSDWYMESKERQAHLGMVYSDVMASEPKMLLSIECQ